jgi:hypothetical protein
MPKTISKTLASEIAARTLAITNPQNRAIALKDTLRRHGFDAMPAPDLDTLLSQAALVDWLKQSYSLR